MARASRFGLGQSAGHQGGGAQQGIQGATGNSRKSLENRWKNYGTCMEYLHYLVENLWKQHLNMYER